MHNRFQLITQSRTKQKLYRIHTAATTENTSLWKRHNWFEIKAGFKGQGFEIIQIYIHFPEYVP